MELSFKVEGAFLLYIQEVWHQHHRFPTSREFMERLSLSNTDTNTLLAREGVQKSLERRGIAMPGSEDFTPLQLAAINTYLNIYDSRSEAQKLKDLGVTMTKWNGWMKGAKFRDYVMTRAADIFSGETLAVAQHQLSSGVAKGSIRHLRLFFDVQKWESEKNAMGDVRQFMSRVIETIQRHVSDQDVLKAIASDFEAIMSGQQPVIQAHSLGVSLAEIEARAEAQHMREE